MSTLAQIQLFTGLATALSVTLIVLLWLGRARIRHFTLWLILALLVFLCIGSTFGSALFWCQTYYGVGPHC